MLLSAKTKMDNKFINNLIQKQGKLDNFVVDKIADISAIFVS